MKLSAGILLGKAVCVLGAVMTAAACSSPDSRARQALTKYESAVAADDLPRARQALLQLVNARDDVADYWLELGRLESTMGNYREAYFAFMRAYELNRRDPAILRALTELAVRGGATDEAQQYAQDLDVIAPGDLWVKLARGFGALGESRFDDALELSEAVLAEQPYDSAAKVLKARVLIGNGRHADAIALLKEQVRVQPADGISRLLLLRLYERQDDWPGISETLSQFANAHRLSSEERLLFIRAAFRSGNIGQARRASLDLLTPDADISLITSVTDLWLDHWPSNQRILDARRLARDASGDARKLTYAAFLSRAGSPADALRLAARAARLPVRPENVQANAVTADALYRTGKIEAAKALLDAVLQFDPGNASALRSRAELHLKTGNEAAAVVDAQDLVVAQPHSARDRLLLARALNLAGDSRSAQRVLWNAFQEVPADASIYSALSASRQGRPEAMRQLSLEFARQRDAKLLQGSI